MKQDRQWTGFGWVDLVIILAVVGTIAAVAVPRISSAARGVADTSLHEDLARLRRAIELYAAEHNGQFPARDNNADTFIKQLSQRTDVNGHVGLSDEHLFGPYLEEGIPVLSVGPNRGAYKVMIAATGPTIDETATDIGWVYNSRTGLIVANTDDLDESGTGYDLY